MRCQPSLNLAPVPPPLVDFRSDTVTRPTDEMRQAMASAEVGDAVFGEDPTVNALEEATASVMGVDAAVYVPSGIMANQIAISLLTSPGDEILCDGWAHIRNYELGAGSLFSGVSFRTVDNPDGSVHSEDIEQLLAGSASRPSAVTMVSIENTHNTSGGYLAPLEDVVKAADTARQMGANVHLDGARLWNATAATGEPPGAFGAAVDVASVCFSKGLGAPVGSALCGPDELVEEARQAQRRFGGGMRQAGVLAAAALIGLRDRDRLVEDHSRAFALRNGLGEVFPEAVGGGPTNMVTLNDHALGMEAEDFVADMAKEGVLVGVIKPGVVRFVTHRDIDDAAVAQALGAARTIAAGVG